MWCSSHIILIISLRRKDMCLSIRSTTALFVIVSLFSSSAFGMNKFFGSGCHNHTIYSPIQQKDSEDDKPKIGFDSLGKEEKMRLLIGSTPGVVGGTKFFEKSEDYTGGVNLPDFKKLYTAYQFGKYLWNKNNSNNGFEKE